MTGSVAERRQMGSGPGDVLGLVRRGTATTRRGVQEVTGLSRMTVAQRIDTLIDAGLLHEIGAEESTGGRRASRLAFDEVRSAFAVAVVDTAHARTAVTDRAGRVIVDQELEIHVTDGPEVVLGRLRDSLRELLDGVDAELSGVGISVPGPIDPVSHRPSEPPIMPGWDGFPIAETLSESFGVPVVVANDADALAFGEQCRSHADARSVCVVKVSTGIGAGLVIDGRVYCGSDGGAGDIGHIRLAGVDAVCQCGSRGCLAAIASGGAVARELTAIGRDARSGRDVRRLLAGGDVEAATLTHEAGRRIGEVMATVVSMVNPGVLVLSGDLASAQLIGGLRETLYPRSLPRATRNLSIVLSELGDDAGVIGIALLVAESLYSVDAVNGRLA
jgi:predicted NBD/HSP70 family sugar kinase